MASASKRARTACDGEEEEEEEEEEAAAAAAFCVAAGFETPIFGAPVVGQVFTLPDDGPLASLDVHGVASDGAGAWYLATGGSVLHLSAVGEEPLDRMYEPSRHSLSVRSVATCPEGGRFEGIAVSPDGSTLFVADCRGQAIRKVEAATGALTTLAGSGSSGSANGVGVAAHFNGPTYLALSPDGGTLFVADTGNARIRRVDVASGAVTTLAGGVGHGSIDGVGDAARFQYPYGLALSPDGRALFVADCGSDKVRRVEVLNGAVTTLAGCGRRGGTDGAGNTARFHAPIGIAMSPDGSALFVTDFSGHKIRRVEVVGRAVTTLAGKGWGSADGVSKSAQLSFPGGVAMSADGSTLLVRSGAPSSALLCLVCLVPPPPPDAFAFAPIVVPPSTLPADLKKARGDATLPQGMVTFVVGRGRQRLEHVSKNVLCVRSDYFRTMFGAGMKERDAAEVTVPHADLATFTALVDYLFADELDLGEEEAGRVQRALALRQLAQMYQVPRLELLCAQALQQSVVAETAVPLLEAAHTMGDGRLLAQCRRYVADNATEVRASGGVEQLRNLGVAKGLLGDALDQVTELQEALDALRVD